MVRKSIFSTMAIFALLFSQAAVAQSSRVDIAGFLKSCVRGDCLVALRAKIEQVLQLNLAPDDFNSRLAVLASGLFQAAGRADGLTDAQLVEALQLLAVYSTDADQVASFIRVAAQISNGAAGLFDLDAPFAVSPS